MVTQFRRHEEQNPKKPGSGCKYSNRKKYPEPRKHKDCNCMCAMDGFVTTPTGERITMRGSLNTRNWKHGSIKLDAMVEPYLRGEAVEEDITVADAIKIFLNVKRTSLAPRNKIRISEGVTLFRARQKKKIEQKRRDAGLGAEDAEQDGDQEQVRKYRDVLVPLKSYCEKHGLVLLKQITVYHLDELLQSMKGRPIWGLAPGDVKRKILDYEPKTQAGKQRYQQNLRIFFKFAVERRGWITKNPALSLDPVKAGQEVIIPYTDDEWNRIESNIEPTFPKVHRMVTAYVLLLRNSALRMGDVTKFGPKDHPNGAVEVVMEKTDDPVWVPLPDSVLEALTKFQPKNPNHYFWSGNGDLETAKKDWSEKMLSLFRAAGIEGGSARRSHNFRKTMASQIMEQEGSVLEDAQMLLGHKNPKTTLKYARFGQKRRARLAGLVKAVQAGT